MRHTEFTRSKATSASSQLTRYARRNQAVPSWGICCALIACAILIGPLLSLRAQEIVTSSITFEVQDPKGLSIVGAEASLVDIDSGTEMSGKSGKTGLVSFGGVSAGKYTLNIKASGFSTYEKIGIEVQGSQQLNLGMISLKMGSNNETVTVRADSNALDTSSPTVANTLSTLELDELSVRSHDAMEFISTLPGVVDTCPQCHDVPGTGTYGNLNMNGSRNDAINVNTDGLQSTMPSSSGQVGAMTAVPAPEMIKEIKVSSSNYGADTGANAGPTISIITRSGERKFHGSFDFPYRNAFLNANSPDNKKQTPKALRPAYDLLLPTGTFSGPLVIPHLVSPRADLFFFVGVRYQRQNTDNGIQFDTVPTLAERAGDFSKSGDQAGAIAKLVNPPVGFNSSLGSLQSGCVTANQISPSCIDPTGLKILNLLPLPNTVSTVGCAGGVSPCGYNYSYDPTTLFVATTSTAHFDWNPERRSYGLSFSYIEAPTQSTGPSGNGSSNTVNRGDYASTAFSHSATVTIRNTITSTLVNAFNIGLNYSGTDQSTLNPTLTSVQGTGIQAPVLYPGADLTGGIPDFSFGGANLANTPTIAQSGGFPSNIKTLVFDSSEKLSKVFTRHVVSAGFNLAKVQFNAWNNQNTRGAFSFAQDTNNPFDSGHPFANALLGIVDKFSQDQLRMRSHTRSQRFESYLQDEWRVTGNTTLTAGVRFYQDPAPYDKDNNMYAFVPSLWDAAAAPTLLWPAVTGTTRSAVDPVSGKIFNSAFVGFISPGTGDLNNGVVRAGTNGVPRSIMTLAPLRLSPRVGFAISPFPSNKFVVRGGGGWYFSQPSFHEQLDAAIPPPSRSGGTIQYTSFASLAIASGSSLHLPPAVNSLATMKTPVTSTVNYSIGFERTIGRTGSFTVTYVGSQTRHNPQTKELNAIPLYAKFNPANLYPTGYATVSANTGLQGVVPDGLMRIHQGFQHLWTNFFGGNANYNSVQVAFTENLMKRKLSLRGNYTYGKTLTTSDGLQSDVSAYTPATMRSYGPAGFDERHLYNLTFISFLPKPGKALGSRLLGTVTDGWELNGTVSGNTGLPITPSYGLKNSPEITGSSTDDGFDSPRVFVINPNAPPQNGKYAAPEVGTFGNVGINSVRWPFGIRDSLTLVRNFYIHERIRSAFRLTAFDFTNSQISHKDDTTLQFNQPGSSINTSPTAFTLNELTTVHQRARTLELEIKASF